MTLTWLPLSSSPRWARRAEGHAPFREPSLSPGELPAASVFVPLARPLRELMSTLARAPEASAPDDERLPWLDEVAVRLIAAAAAFCDEPQALIPAQRSLLLLAGRRGTVKADLADLSRALRRIDEQVGSTSGGFSRLLDAALSAGDVVTEERLDASRVDEELRPLALALETVARELLALDDLAHAFSLPADLPAGAVVLEGTLDLAEGAGAIREEDTSAVALSVIERRGLDRRLASLIELRGALEHTSDAVVDDASRAQVSKPLSLWILAHRLARHERLEEAADRAALDRLLASAGLVPLEVFDAASLWRDLADDER